MTRALSSDKVVFVDDKSSPGGAELSLVRYFEWAERSIAVELVAYEEGPLVDRATRAGVPVTVLFAPGEERPLFQKLVRLRAALSRSEARVVVCNSLNAAAHVALLPRWRGRRIVNYLRQSAIPFGASKLRRAFFRFFAHRRFDAVITNSQWTADSVAKVGVSRDRIDVAYPISGVLDVSPHKKNAGRLPQVRVLSLSRLSPLKGLHTVIESASILAKRGKSDLFEFSLAGGALFGEHDYAERLESMVAGELLPVTFYGHVDDVGRLLEEHDFLVLASIEPEPFGQVIIQGLSRGLITISTAQGGPMEIMEDGVSGFFYETGDANALADLLLALAEDPDRCGRVRDAALRRAEGFLDPITLKGLEQVLQDQLAALSRKAAD